ncbi:Mur ligase [Chlamydoabsidia padenii]|nr:Mur ligase [Chlamydoabsidia padenii]
MDFGLDRIYKLLEHLGNPHEKLSVIHVAGTNGKGSVCAYITRVLLQAGYKVGRFNSPHLIAPHDSVQINGDAVNANLFEESSQAVITINNNHHVGASSFEILVGTALSLFVKHQESQGLDFVVVEVGLGGLLDATNVFPSPVMTVITSIGMDHMGVLGNSIGEIAGAKAGIMKKGCPVVIAPQAEPMAETTLVDCARALDISCVVMVPGSATNQLGGDHLTGGQQIHLEHTPKDITKGTALPLINVDYTVALQGDYQRENSATAVMALEWMTHLGLVTVSKDILQKGMANTRWPGRLDWIDTTLVSTTTTFPRLLVDGAHNPPACRELRRYVNQVLDRHRLDRVIWIIGVTTGKSLNDMLPTLIRDNDVILTVPFSQPEGMPWIQCVDPVTLAQHADYAENQKQALPQVSLQDALLAASSLYHQETDLVVLCGSLYLVADLYRSVKRDSS